MLLRRGQESITRSEEECCIIFRTETYGRTGSMKIENVLNKCPSDRVEVSIDWLPGMCPQSRLTHPPCSYGRLAMPNSHGVLPIVV